MAAQSATPVQTCNLDLAVEADRLLAGLGVDRASYTEGTLVVRTPITGETIGEVHETTAG